MHRSAIAENKDHMQGPDGKEVDMTTPITRRSFMRISASSMASFAIFDSLTSRLWAEPFVSYPGIQLYTVDKELKGDVNGTLKAIRGIGYREVEGAGFAGLSAKEFRTALDSAGLKCNSTHFFNFGEADPSAIFDEANTLGVKYVVSSFIGKFGHNKAGGEAGAGEYKAMAAYFNELGASAKKAGLQLAYHNHNTEFKDLGNGKVGYDIFVESTDADLVKLELDCGWIVAAGHNPVDYFKSYPNRYRMVHIKDFLRTGQPSTSLDRSMVPQGTVLGAGHIKYKPILAAAKAAGVEHFFIEQEPPFLGTTAMEAARRDYEYLESITK